MAATGKAPTYVSVGESLRIGWNRGATHFLQFLPVLLAMLVAAVAFHEAAGYARQLMVWLLLGCMQLIAPVALSFGLWRLALPIVDDQPVSWRTAWALRGLDAYIVAFFGLALPWAVLSIVSLGIAFIFGMPMVAFFPFGILERKRSYRETIKDGWSVAGTHYAAVLRLCLVLLGLNLLGFIVLIGWLITIPLTVIALAHAYRTGSGERGTWV